MDESIRAEYQRRLDAGDKYGAMAYLRMLRGETQNAGEIRAYDEALASLEGGAGTAAGAVDSTYSGATGPFGDHPDQWAAGEQSHRPAPEATGGWTPVGGQQPAGPPPPSYGGAPSYPGTHAGVPAPAQHPAAGGLGGVLGDVGAAIGGRFEHAFDNVTGGGGRGETPLPHAAAPPPAAAHGQTPAEFIGGRIEHAFENVTGQGTPHQSGNQPVHGEQTSSEGGNAEGTPL